MNAVSIPSGSTPTLILAAGSASRQCDIINDSDTTIRLCYDGSDQSALSTTPGAEVGYPLFPGATLSLSQTIAKAVYGVHAAGVAKRVQIQGT